VPILPLTGDAAYHTHPSHSFSKTADRRDA
jgi:hypothetical protein